MGTGISLQLIKEDISIIPNSYWIFTKILPYQIIATKTLFPGRLSQTQIYHGGLYFLDKGTDICLTANCIFWRG